MARGTAPFRSVEGLSRLGTAIKTATSSYSSTKPTTEDITVGEIVEVTHTGGLVATSTTVRRRATGAILLSLTSGQATPPTASNDPGWHNWEIIETAGTSILWFWSQTGHPTVTARFWVF